MRAFALSTIIAALACTAAQRPCPAAAAASLSTSPSTAPCPVTLPRPAATRYGAYSNAYLGVDPDREGRFRVARPRDAADEPSPPLPVTLRWWRWQPGALEVTARRLDAPSPTLRAKAGASDGESGFQTSTLFFPSEGCWEITGRTPVGQLTFVTRVEWEVPGERERALRERLAAIESDVRWRYPRRVERRDAPLRPKNIADAEVREIQAIFGPSVRPEMLNIGGVVTGCPCEDGEECAEQVWVVVSAPGRTYGLQLSRIEDRWTIGPLQRWWLEYDGVDGQAGHGPPQRSFEEFQAMLRKAPRCDTDAAL